MNDTRIGSRLNREFLHKYNGEEHRTRDLREIREFYDKSGDTLSELFDFSTIEEMLGRNEEIKFILNYVKKGHAFCITRNGKDTLESMGVFPPDGSWPGYLFHNSSSHITSAQGREGILRQAIRKMNGITPGILTDAQWRFYNEYMKSFDTVGEYVIDRFNIAPLEISSVESVSQKPMDVEWLGTNRKSNPKTDILVRFKNNRNPLRISVKESDGSQPGSSAIPEMSRIVRYSVNDTDPTPMMTDMLDTIDMMTRMASGMIHLDHNIRQTRSIPGEQRDSILWHEELADDMSSKLSAYYGSHPMENYLFLLETLSGKNKFGMDSDAAADWVLVYSPTGGGHPIIYSCEDYAKLLTIHSVIPKVDFKSIPVGRSSNSHDAHLCLRFTSPKVTHFTPEEIQRKWMLMVA